MKNFLILILTFMSLVMTSCTKTGTFTIIDTDPHSYKADELIGKHIHIEKIGSNLKVNFEGEPEEIIFRQDKEYSSIYVASTPWGTYYLHYSSFMNGFSTITVTGGSLWHFKNGTKYEVYFE